MPKKKKTEPCVFYFRIFKMCKWNSYSVYFYYDNFMKIVYFLEKNLKDGFVQEETST